MEKIYLDYNATTPLDPRVLESMLPFFKDSYGNPSSIHSFGNKAKAALDEAREKVAEFVNARPREIIFTTGGSESNNHAIKGAAFALRSKGNHLITVQTEHASCLEVFRFLEKQGFDVTYLPVDKDGLLNIDQLEKSITDKTVLISTMYVNNETGVINPVKEIGEIAREHDILFHADMVQAAGKIGVKLGELPVDLASFSSHKLYGPKGTGALFVRKGVNITSLVHGGGQERGRRSGTENVAGIYGFGKACEIAKNEMQNEWEKTVDFEKKFYEVISGIPGTYINGSRDYKVANTLNFGFDNIEGDSLVMNLDLEGIAASTGSACSEGNVDASHVLLAMGLEKNEAKSSLRISYGRFTTENEVRKTLEILPKVVKRIRDLKEY